MSPPPPLLCGILSIDAAISGSLHSLFSPVLPPSLLLLLEISADFRFSFPVSLSLLLVSPPPLRRSFLFPFLAGLLLDLILVGLLKIIFRRSRPSYNHPSMSAAVSADHFSFPSGHASRVFFIAAAVSAAADLSIGAISVGVWVWAAVTAMSRVFLGRHYVLDVVAGACLGVLEAVFVFRYLRFEETMMLFETMTSFSFRMNSSSIQQRPQNMVNLIVL